MKTLMKILKPFYQLNSFFIHTEITAGYIVYGISFLCAIGLYIYGCTFNLWEWGHWFSFFFMTVAYVIISVAGITLLSGMVVVAFRVMYLATMPFYYLYDWAYYSVNQKHIPDPFDDAKKNAKYSMFMAIDLYDRYERYEEKKKNRANENAYKKTLEDMDVAYRKKVDQMYKMGYEKGMKAGSLSQIQKAMAILLIENENFTERDLRERKKLMMSKFHPDANGGKYEEEACKYNEAYEILSSYLKQKR